MNLRPSFRFGVLTRPSTKFGAAMGGLLHVLVTALCTTWDVRGTATRGEFLYTDDGEAFGQRRLGGLSAIHEH
jgi:hypothetical protein